MALYQRPSPARSEEKSSHSPQFPPIEQPRMKYHLLVASEVPSWYAHNSFLRTGYRPINGSVTAIALAGSFWVHLYFRNRYPIASLGDRLALVVYLTTSVLCFGISSIYHTLLCHSEGWSGIWGRLDYMAIILQTIGSFVSGIYFTFYCYPGLQKLYWTMIGLLGLLSTIILINPRFQSNQWKMLRLSTFVATGLSGLLPIAHAASIYPCALLNQQAGLGYYVVEGLALIIGVGFYATHFPESWVPEKFDIWGASHQIFHLFVVLSAGIHVWGILSVFDWIYKNPQC